MPIPPSLVHGYQNSFPWQKFRVRFPADSKKILWGSFGQFSSRLEIQLCASTGLPNFEGVTQAPRVFDSGRCLFLIILMNSLNWIMLAHYFGKGKVDVWFSLVSKAEKMAFRRVRRNYRCGMVAGGGLIRKVFPIMFFFSPSRSGSKMSTTIPAPWLTTYLVRSLIGHLVSHTYT